MTYAVSVNVYAGNAMIRRSLFQCGVLLLRSPFGHIDQSIGKNTAAGKIPHLVQEDFVVFMV
jgi:alkyl sulfatase BDS1-like metallo-beta-lactamase superfamily hydrolase